MLSFAGRRMGRGWGFALHEALDQTGATVGPLIVAAVMYLRSDYRLSFAVLLVPALISLAVLLAARASYPRPRDLESKTPQMDMHGYAKPFWLYLAATACIAAGFADYPLIAYHFGNIPGFGKLNIRHLVSDFTGTLSIDGCLLPGVQDMLAEVERILDVHVLTADTFRKAHAELKGVECSLTILSGADIDRQKERYIQDLGPEQVIAIGNGANDRLILARHCRHRGRGVRRECPRECRYRGRGHPRGIVAAAESATNRRDPEVIGSA